MADKIVRISLNLETDGKGWRCDCEQLPGSPPVGRGSTREQAIGAWFIVQRDYVAKLEGTIVLAIDGELWRLGRY